jgi:putative ABC transport system substrate-binding protein
VRRRDFITLVGGAAAAWPLAARAQQNGVRRIGMLMVQGQDDADGQARKNAFLQALQHLGWTDGRNLRLDYRWCAGDPNLIRKGAAELAALVPDVILTSSAAAVGPLLQATRTVPVVFVLVADPIGAGFVKSLAHPGGNATGFTAVEYDIGSKWLELLKQVAPDVTRAAIIQDAGNSAGAGLFGAIQSAASRLGIGVAPIDVRDAAGTARALAVFASEPHGGIVITASPLAITRREELVALAAQYKLPAVYFTRSFVAAGGLVSYTPDVLDQYREAASYADRILKGAKPADLPIQQPNKFQLVINLKTAKTLGLTVSAPLLATADEVIE